MYTKIKMELPVVKVWALVNPETHTVRLIMPTGEFLADQFGDPVQISRQNLEEFARVLRNSQNISINNLPFLQFPGHIPANFNTQQTRLFK